jgi:choline dehydrogenase-like flavoprotein
MSSSEFDYVVIGGGSAGSVIAGRLSEDPNTSVVIFEAGGHGDSWLVKAPAGAVAMLPTSINNYAYETVPQSGLNGRRGYQPRGKCLGGSSAINAMVYIRGHKTDYDRWAEMGNQGWSYDDLLPYFLKSENNAVFSGPYHGNEGPLHVSNLQTHNPFQQIYLNAAKEAGFRINHDFNAQEQEGLGIYQVTQKNGERWSAARGYLLPHINSRSNLQLRGGVQVERILFEGRRAVGVAFKQNGVKHELRARKEVILCAGAFNSPQLLMVSGVGPAKHLQEFGIHVVHDLPGVGKNLQDHPDFTFGYEAKSLDLVGVSLAAGARLTRELIKYLQSREGMLATNYAEAGGFLKTDPALPAPDIQLHFVIGIVDDHARNFRLAHGYSCHVCLLRPKSRGQVTLASPDMRRAPLIDPGFLVENEDLETLVAGFKLTRKLMDAQAFSRIRHKDLFTANVRTDDDIRQVIRERADTVYHPVGTCKMGTDEMAVVDAQLKVHGIQGLRVVDGSVMPTLIGGNTNAPIIAIAEKAIDLIRSNQGV